MNSWLEQITNVGVVGHKQQLVFFFFSHFCSLMWTVGHSPIIKNHQFPTQFGTSKPPVVLTISFTFGVFPIPISRVRSDNQSKRLQHSFGKLRRV